LRTHEAHARMFSWGLADQVFSSATNVGFALLAGRVLGPDGLGVTFVGFSAYWVALAFMRSLVSDPLVTCSAAAATTERARVARYGLALTIAGGLAAAALLTVCGLAIPGHVGRGLLVFAPWIAPLVLQDYWRAVLFRDGRGGAAAVNDGTWLVAMAVFAPLAAVSPSEWTVVAAWAGAAAVAAALGFVQTRALPASPRESFHWWRADAWPLGRWLAANAAVYSLTSYALVIVLVAMLGPTDFGGLQAAIMVFAPFSLVASALASPGLPAMSRAVAGSFAAARRFAFTVGLVAVVMTGAYLLVMSVAGTWFLTLLFGSSFEQFGHLVWPIASGQLPAAAALGFTLLLTAQRRGRAVLLGGAVATNGAQLVFATPLAWHFGLTGAAWGIAAGTAFGALTKMALALSGSSAPVRGAPELPTAPSTAFGQGPLS
jgi:O-antigen/teichoic acid export membrane protein